MNKLLWTLFALGIVIVPLMFLQIEIDIVTVPAALTILAVVWR